jgi:hypothetical protein
MTISQTKSLARFMARKHAAALFRDIQRAEKRGDAAVVISNTAALALIAERNGIVCAKAPAYLDVLVEQARKKAASAGRPKQQQQHKAFEARKGFFNGLPPYLMRRVELARKSANPPC